jgi:hypothetical protein
MGRLLPSTAKDCLILVAKAPRLPLVPTLRATVLQRRLTCWLANFSTNLDYRPIILHRLNREQRSNRGTEIITMFQPFFFWLDGPHRAGVGDARRTRMCTGDPPQPSSDGVQLTDDQRSRCVATLLAAEKPERTHDDVISLIREYRRTH